MNTDNIATLVAYDCWALLEEAEVARIAWRSGDGIGLVPVNYVVVDGALWFRTDAESELARGCGGQSVVVEVDHVDTESGDGWSILVHGVPELIDVLDVPDMVVEMRVWAGGPRTQFIRIEPDRVTGRRLWKS
jgi:nitroimidazol reductase NimA-like FMN-containing flavoprotein (pyridoxamine 5'-phosphate oxidase superfamily)